jgi:hypothetical protein
VLLCKLLNAFRSWIFLHILKKTGVEIFNKLYTHVEKKLSNTVMSKIFIEVPLSKHKVYQMAKVLKKCLLRFRGCLDESFATDLTLHFIVLCFVSVILVKRNKTWGVGAGEESV